MKVKLIKRDIYISIAQKVNIDNCNFVFTKVPE